MIVASMQMENLDIKQKIKNFFKENEISFIEDEKHIKIEGEIFYVTILQFTEISMKIKQDKYLIVTHEKEKIILTYQETFPEEIEKKIEIQKNGIQAIYYYNDKLVILF
jgi:hypothetical protein